MKITILDILMTLGAAVFLLIMLLHPIMENPKYDGLNAMTHDTTLYAPSRRPDFPGRLGQGER